MKESESNTLVWAVVAITAVTAGSIAALVIWHPGDNTAAITAILSVVGPAVGVLVLLLQGQRTAKRVDEAAQKVEEAKVVVDETKVKVDEVKQGVKKAAVRAVQAAEKVEQAKQETAAKVDSIKEMVNGRQAELQRRIAELEYEEKRAAKVSPVVIVANAQGTIKSISPSVTPLLRFKTGELIGKSIELLIPDRYRPAHRARLAELLEDGDPVWLETGRTIMGHANIKGGGEIAVAVDLNAWKDKETEEWVITGELRQRREP